MLMAYTSMLQTDIAVTHEHLKSLK